MYYNSNSNLNVAFVQNIKQNIKCEKKNCKRKNVNDYYFQVD